MTFEEAVQLTIPDWQRNYTSLTAARIDLSEPNLKLGWNQSKEDWSLVTTEANWKGGVRVRVWNYRDPREGYKLLLK